MHQLQIALLGAHRPERLDQPQAHPGTGMNGHPRGFVQREQIRVFVDYGVSQRGLQPFRDVRPSIRRSLRMDWRDAQPITGTYSIGGPDPTAIDARLPASQHAVNAALRDPLEDPRQKIVDAPAGVLGHDLHVAHLPGCRYRSVRRGHHRCRLLHGGIVAIVPQVVIIRSVPRGRAAPATEPCRSEARLRRDRARANFDAPGTVALGGPGSPRAIRSR